MEILTLTLAFSVASAAGYAIGWWLRGSCHQPATKQDLMEFKEQIMSAISEYNDRVSIAFGEIGQNVDGLVTSLAGLTSDVERLKQIILDLQNNPGPITPEDQALLNDGVTIVTALASKVASAAAVAKALDEATVTPPTPPPV